MFTFSEPSWESPAPAETSQLQPYNAFAHPLSEMMSCKMIPAITPELQSLQSPLAGEIVTSAAWLGRATVEPLLTEGTVSELEIRN
ncbi:hypothetical protein PG997_000323 [Apiospora hydei]|uniref:Uncharacterized protein n=1 Tax=Apiospora hydei TaxID=1337664 RepID=A0ABR1XAD7_9PEZI